MPLVEPEIRELWQPGELDRVKVRVVGPEELLVGKLLALLDRSAARDVWDVANLSTETLEMVRSHSFRRRFIAFSAILDHPLFTYTKERLQTILTDRTLSENLAPMLASSEPPVPADLIDRAWDVMHQFLSLEPHEKEYIAGISRGALLLHLLFAPGSNDTKIITEHPAVLWKIQNVRNHLANRSEKRKDR